MMSEFSVYLSQSLNWKRSPEGSDGRMVGRWGRGIEMEKEVAPLCSLMYRLPPPLVLIRSARKREAKKGGHSLLVPPIPTRHFSPNSSIF